MSADQSSFHLVKTSGTSSMPAARLVSRQPVRNSDLGPWHNEHAADLHTQSVASLVVAAPVNVVANVVHAEPQPDGYRVTVDDAYTRLAIEVGRRFKVGEYQIFEVSEDQRFRAFQRPQSTITISEEFLADVAWQRADRGFTARLWTMFDTARGDANAQLEAATIEEFDNYVHPLRAVERLVAATVNAVLPPSKWDE